MEHRLTIDNGATVVTPLVARLDAHVAPAFRGLLLKQVEEGCHHLVIDLGHVGFIDSSGLGTIVAALKRIGTDGTLTVRSLTTSVRSMFELTTLDRIITIVESPRP